MKRLTWTVLLLLPVALSLAGCGGSSPTPPAERAAADDAAVKTNLAKLSTEDRQLAEAQKFCAVEGESRLGAMGEPFKVTVNGQTVFLCCKGCRKQALADPDKTLAAVESLKKNSRESAP